MICDDHVNRSEIRPGEEETTRVGSVVWVPFDDVALLHRPSDVGDPYASLEHSSHRVGAEDEATL